MKTDFKITNKSVRNDVIFSNMALAIFVVVSFNGLISLLIISKCIQLLEFDKITFAIKNGYYTLNNYEVGIPLIANLFVFLGLWRLMVWDTFRNIKNQTAIKETANSSNNFFTKLVHLFF